MPAKDDAVVVLRLQLTRSELSSLLMAQINQTRHSRLTQGEDHPNTRTDIRVLEKLVSAQRDATFEAWAS